MLQYKQRTHRHIWYLRLESLPFLHCQTVRLSNDGDHVDNLTELLHYNDVNGAQRVPSRVDEEQATVDTRVLNMALAHGRELLAEIRTVLVLDVLYNGIPTSNQCSEISRER